MAAASSSSAAPFFLLLLFSSYNLFFGFSSSRNKPVGRVCRLITNVGNQSSGRGGRQRANASVPPTLADFIPFAEEREPNTQHTQLLLCSVLIFFLFSFHVYFFFNTFSQKQRFNRKHTLIDSFLFYFDHCQLLIRSPFPLLHWF